MTKDDVLRWLEAQLSTLQDWGCIHQDAFGTHYAPEYEADVTSLELVIDAVRELHEAEFVAEWLRWNTGPGFDGDADTRWREEMGL